MLKTSLTSVTFRQKEPEEIVRLAARAGLDAIEWGGDIHLPPGSPAAAEKIRQCTETHGLAVSAYGSYYRAGPGEDFSAVLATAQALGCRLIRVWAGAQGSAAMPPEERAALESRLQQAVRAAEAAGCTVATEYHANTLTDTLDSTLALLAAVPGLRTFWQPPVGLAEAENRRALDALSPAVESLHVYHRDDTGEKRPLAEGRDAWRGYLAQAAALPGIHYATLEFVQNDSEAQFFQDAAVLRELVEEVWP